MVVKVKEVNGVQEFDRYLIEKNGSPFSSSLFLEPIRSGTNEPLYLLFEEEGLVLGGVSGIITSPANRILKRIRFLNAVTFYTGPFTDRPERIGEVNACLYRYIKGKGYSKYVNHGYDMSRNMDVKGSGIVSKVHPEFKISFNESLERIRMKYHKNLRRNIRKAKGLDEEYGISTDPDDIDILDRLIDQTEKSRLERGYRGFEKSYLPHLNVHVLKKMVGSGIARLPYIKENNEIQSILFLISTGKRSVSIFIGTSQRGYEIESSALLHDKVIESLKNEGCLQHNTLGLPRVDWEGLERFKLSYGAEKVETWSMISPFLQNKVLKKLWDLAGKR